MNGSSSRSGRRYCWQRRVERADGARIHWARDDVVAEIPAAARALSPCVPNAGDEKMRRAVLAPAPIELRLGRACDREPICVEPTPAAYGHRDGGSRHNGRPALYSGPVGAGLGVRLAWVGLTLTVDRVAATRALIEGDGSRHPEGVVELHLEWGYGAPCAEEHVGCLVPKIR